MAVVDAVMKRRKVEIEARIAEIDDLYRDALKAVELMSRHESVELGEDCAMMGHGLDLLSCE